jgi:uncharacterized repeat protein (TIGR01451 family)
VLFSGCGSSEGEAPKTGSLNINVNPTSATVVVTGPSSFTQTFTGNKALADLAPGQYTAKATWPGFVESTNQVDVVAGQTSSISLALQLTDPTVGSLNVNVNPPSAAVVVTGPASFTKSFTGNQLLANLAPGQYQVQATAPGFSSAASSINVVAGQTSSISLILQATPIISEAPRAVYRDASGNLIPLESSDFQSGQFVFYAWLQDLPSGVVPGDLTPAFVSGPGKPLDAEQVESAPSLTQNLAVAWVGFTDPSGVVRPVIGADVRWEIDQQWAGRVGSMQFGTSDDNRVALAYGVFDDQADTRTNNARLQAERFPLIATEFPLYNQSGIGTPFVDGLTWVTLFSPDKVAAGRIVAVATINGEEIGKQILFKNFAPSPKLEITKTVSSDIVNLVAGTGTVTWTVTVTNVGSGDAAVVNLSDILASGAGVNYTIVAPPGATAIGDGFNYSFPLASGTLLGDAESFGVLADATVTNTGSSVVNGNIGVSAGSAVTGFPPGLVTNGTIHNNDAAAQAAQTALTNAYVALGQKLCTAPVNTPLTGTLTPGVYCYNSSVLMTGTLVLDAKGDPAAEFIFKIGTSLTTATGASVSLINGATACNVHWQVGSSATLGTTSVFAGNILAQASITAGTGASLSGRALARTGTVTLDGNAVDAPLSCVAAPRNVKVLTFTATVNAPGTYCNEAQILSYNSATAAFIPVDLKAQACFTALESNLSIVKDFVADDQTTSLGKAVTVAANVPASLRVRVINNGTGGATGVAVNDVLNASGGGLLANYTVTNIPSGSTANGNGGFDTAIGDLAAGATTTLLFTVAGSVDATYCDTATVTATSGTIGIDNDSACLTVATPKLTITKEDAPASVIPGANYTSTIVVANTGHATARNVVITDALGLDSAANVYVIYVSSSLNGAGGSLANNLVTANTIDIPAGESMTFTVVSRIPLAAASGDYCDQANVTSSNAVSPEQVQACVHVPAFSALQTQLVDLADPIAVGSNVTYFSVLYVEELSNEGLSNSKLKYSFGLPGATGLGTPGKFQVVSTKVYLDSKPVRDPVTGMIVSDPSSATAVLLTAATDYTVDDSTLGLQLLNMASGVVLRPDTALYLVHVVVVPSGTQANHTYTTSYVWDSVGLVSTTAYQASSSEPTTVLP